MPRPRPTGPWLEVRRGRHAIVWWEGRKRRRTSTGTADIAAAEKLLAEFKAKGWFWELAEMRRRNLVLPTTRLYVIGSDSVHKIGVSNAPDDRLAQLQSSHSHKLVLVRQWHVDEDRAATVERRAHRLLAERRMEGEWFDVSAEVACAAVCVAMAVDPYRSKADATDRK